MTFGALEAGASSGVKLRVGTLCSVTSKVAGAGAGDVAVCGFTPMLEATNWWLAPELISMAASSMVLGLVFWLLNMLVSATRPVSNAVAISGEIVTGGLIA